MGTYYRGSTCNLAAAHANDCHGGLFSKRSHFAAQACLVQPRWSRSSSQTYLIHDAPGQFIRMAKESRLGRRGWIKQELTLAPRTIYFAECEVFWECASTMAAESMPKQPLVGSFSNKPESGPQIWAINDSPGKTEMRMRAMNWARVVTSYSSCELTYPVKDKLAAIGGLAQTFGSPYEYLAGLWKSDLAQWLLWRPYGAKRYAEYIAPSWSWASMDGYVRFEVDLEQELVGTEEDAEDGTAGAERHDDRNIASIRKSIQNRRPLFSIVEALAERHGPHGFGRVSGGHLCLTGLPFCVPDRSELKVRVTSEVGEIVVQLHPDNFELHWLAPIEPKYVFFPIRFSHRHELAGLLLLPTGRKRGEFERAGLFTLECEDETVDVTLEHLSLVFGANLICLESSECFEKTGRKRADLEESVVVIV